MIDIDDELLFEIDKARPVDVGTFDDEHRVVFAIDGGRHANEISAGKFLISVRRRVAHDDLDVFVEGAQQPIKPQRRSETVAVRANVGSNREPVLVFD